MCVFVSQTAPVSSLDQWICSRLYSTVLQCEQAFPSAELHLVTSGLRSFWLHSLCDVYLVRSCPPPPPPPPPQKQQAQPGVCVCVCARSV